MKEYSVLLLRNILIDDFRGRGGASVARLQNEAIWQTFSVVAASNMAKLISHTTQLDQGGVYRCNRDYNSNILVGFRTRLIFKELTPLNEGYKLYLDSYVH